MIKSYLIVALIKIIRLLITKKLDFTQNKTIILKIFRTIKIKGTVSKIR
jgi:hypothetical protein